MINYYIKDEVIYILDKSYLLCDYFDFENYSTLKLEMKESSGNSFKLFIENKYFNCIIDFFSGIYILTVLSVFNKKAFKGYFSYDLNQNILSKDERFDELIDNVKWFYPKNILEPIKMKEIIQGYLNAPYDNFSFEKEHEKKTLKWQFYLEDNQVFGYVCDITNFANSLKRSIHSEKLRSIGLMTGGIAHDINNKLMVISGSTMLLKKQIENPLLLNYLNNIEEAAKSNALLVKRLLKLSKPPILIKENFNLTQTLNDVIFMISHTSNKARRVVFDCKNKEMLIYGVEPSISNAFLNLCKNAIEALELDEGYLLVKASKTYLNIPPNNLVSKKHFQKGFYFKVDVTDNGKGIPKNIIKRLFTPFSSSKDSDKGTGLGLVQVLGMADDNEVLITLNSKINVGTTFSLYFKEVIFDSVSLEVSRPSILLIDDDNMVRQIIKMLLESLSYQVVDFSNPYEAIRFYEVNHQLISVVICDMMMPLKNGKDTFYELLNIDEEVKFIILSGYTDEQLSQEFLNLISGYLAKPVEIDELRNLINKVLS